MASFYSRNFFKNTEIHGLPKPRKILSLNEERVVFKSHVKPTFEYSVECFLTREFLFLI